MRNPQKTRWQMIRLVVLVAVCAGSVTLYGLLLAVSFGFGISGEGVAVLALCGAAIGLLAWALLALS